MKAKSLLHRAGMALLVLVILAANSFAAYAANLPDLTQKGAISITLRDSKTGAAVSGGEMTLYPVASVSAENGKLMYSYINGFENCGIPLDNVEDSELAGKLQGKLSVSASGTPQTIDAQGKVRYTGLTAGLYLIVQTKNASGYRTSNPFVVSLPMQNDGGWTYQVDASPKVSTSSSSKPSKPSKPSEPDKPSTPDTPDTPDKPSNPDTPGSDIPDHDTPLHPGEHNPDTPDTPSSPETPSTPSKPVKRLPQTGQLNWPIPVLCIGGLVLFSFGWLMRKEERNR